MLIKFTCLDYYQQSAILKIMEVNMFDAGHFSVKKKKNYGQLFLGCLKKSLSENF